MCEIIFKESNVNKFEPKKFLNIFGKEETNIRALSPRGLIFLRPNREIKVKDKETKEELILFKKGDRLEDKEGRLAYPVNPWLFKKMKRKKIKVEITLID